MTTAIDPEALTAYTAAIIRARIEYRDHPFMGSCNGNHQCTARLLRRAASARAEWRRRKEAER